MLSALYRVKFEFIDAKKYSKMLLHLALEVSRGEGRCCIAQSSGLLIDLRRNDNFEAFPFR